VAWEAGKASKEPGWLADNQQNFLTFLKSGNISCCRTLFIGKTETQKTKYTFLLYRL